MHCCSVEHGCSRFVNSWSSVNKMIKTTAKIWKIKIFSVYLQSWFEKTTKFFEKYLHFLKESCIYNLPSGDKDTFCRGQILPKIWTTSLHRVHPRRQRRKEQEPPFVTNAPKKGDGTKWQRWFPPPSSAVYYLGAPGGETSRHSKRLHAHRQTAVRQPPRREPPDTNSPAADASAAKVLWKKGRRASRL